MQHKGEVIARGKEIMNVDLARRGDDMMGLERAVAAMNDHMQLHRCAVADAEQ
jgi:hypothetical protein